MLGDLIQRSESFQAERRKAEQAAKERMSKAKAGNTNAAKTTGPQIEARLNDHQSSQPKRDLIEKNARKASTALAQQVGVNRAAVERADFIRKKTLDVTHTLWKGEAWTMKPNNRANARSTGTS